MFHELAADGAPNSIDIVQGCQTLGAKSMPTMDENSRDLFTNIEGITTKVAKIKSSSLVISLNFKIRLALLLEFV